MTAADRDALPPGVIVLPPDGGRVYEMKTLRAVFKADGQETAGHYSISEWWLDPHKPGPHTHDADDKVFYILEGTVSVMLGACWIDAPKGTFIRVPKGVMHDFENRTGARVGLLTVYIPAGFESKVPGIVDWFNANR